MSIRSALSRRAVRAATVAGVAAVALGTAGSAMASTVAPHVNGFAPTEQCLGWSGTVQYFPALSSTSHKVTAVLNATLNNCNFEGTQQTFSGSVFGVLSGTATGNGGPANLTGKLAITWPADANLNPTISPITLSSPSTGTYSFFGTPTAGAGTGQQLNGAYAKISSVKINGGTQQSILGSAPFQLEVNNG
jgi:hypothetical protein